MEGVNVLYTYDALEFPPMMILCLLFSVFLGITLIIVWSECSTSEKVFSASVVIFMACASIALIQAETKIKATIDDDVKFGEFNERYEVVDQEGDIYTLIEKESEGK